MSDNISTITPAVNGPPVLPPEGGALFTYFERRNSIGGQLIAQAPENFIDLMTTYEIVDMDAQRRLHPDLSPDDLADEAKAGACIVLAWTQGGRKVRGSARWENMIALDVEDDGESSALAPPFADTADKVRALGVSFVVHSTFKHSPEAPRYRIYLWLHEPWDCRRTKGKRAALVARIAERLGIPPLALDTGASSGRVRIFYLPRRPHDGPEPETDSGIFEDPSTGRLTGLDVAELVGDVPFDDAAPQADAEQREAVLAPDQATAAAMLAAIPQEGEQAPDRQAWVEIGMTIFKVFGANGRTLFLEFSKRHASHDLEKFDHTWNSFNATNHPHDPTALRYLERRSIGAFVSAPGMARLREVLRERAAGQVPGAFFPVVIHIKLAAGQEHRELDQTIAVLQHLPTPVFRGGGGLVYVTHDREVNIIDPDDGTRRKAKVTGTKTVTESWLAPELSRVTRYTKSHKERTTPPTFTDLDVYVPRRVVTDLLASNRTLAARPELAGIISTPTMRPGGTLLIKPGFDPETGFWLASDVVLPPIPERPTKEDALAALDIIKELFQEFPFEEPVHRTAAIATMMGGILRPAFPFMPGLMIDAPASGSGKSFLTQLIGFAMLGSDPVVSAWPTPKEEMVKHIDAMLLAGASFLGFDNFNDGEITGNKLCSLLTLPRIDVRILGKSDVLPISTAGVVFIANGNGITTASDASQRFITARIDPMMVDPRERSFVGNPLSALRRDRGRYVGAVLTIAKAYREAGRPGAKDWPNFTAWSRLVRSSLIWLGEPDIRETTRAAIVNDPARELHASIMEIVGRLIGVDQQFTAKDLVDRATASPLPDLMRLAGAVSDAGSRTIPDARAITMQLGRHLGRKMRGVVVCMADGVDRTIVPFDLHQGTKRWRLMEPRRRGG